MIKEGTVISSKSASKSSIIPEGTVVATGNGTLQKNLAQSQQQKKFTNAVASDFFTMGKTSADVAREIKNKIKNPEENNESKTTNPHGGYDKNYLLDLVRSKKVKANKEVFAKAKEDFENSEKNTFLAKTLNIIGGLPTDTYEKSVARSNLDIAKRDYFNSVSDYLSYGGKKISLNLPEKNIYDLENIDSVVAWLANDKKGKVNRKSGWLKADNVDVYNQLEEHEKNILFYLYQEDGSEAAKDFLDYIMSDLNMRATKKTVTEAQKFAQKAPLAATLTSHVTNLGKFAGIGDAIVKNYSGEPLDVYSSAYTMSHITNAIRNQITSDLEKSTNDTPVLKQLNKVTSYIGVDNIPAFVYQAVSSSVDSAVNFAISKGLGAAAGFSGAALNKATSNISSIIMGSQVAQDSIISAKQSGLSDSEAVTLGIIRGSIEGITEKYSIDAILDNPGSILGRGIKSPYKRAFIAEGSEEVSSNWLNRIADALYYGDNNEIKKNYSKYISDGNSEAEAFALTVYDLFKEDASSFIAGGMSGMSMSLTNNILSSIKGANTTKIGKVIAQNELESEVINVALTLNENSEARQLAQRISESGNMGVSEIGQLALYTLEELNNQKSQAISNAVYDRVKALGGSAFDANTVADYYAAVYSGKKVSKAEANTVKNNRFTEAIWEQEEWFEETKNIIADIGQRQSRIYSAVSTRSSKDNEQITPSETENQTPNEQLTPEQREVKQNIIESNSSVLNNGQRNDIINNNQETGVEINGGQQRIYNDSQRIGRTSSDTQIGTRQLQEADGRIQNNGRENRWNASPIRNQGNNRGLTISSEQNERLKSTAVVNDDGTPIVVHHFTDNMDFDIFGEGDIGFHFGSESQAQQHKENLRKQNKLKGEGRIIRAHLAIKNPLRCSYDLEVWLPAHTAIKLFTDGIITQQQYLQIEKMHIESGYDYNSPAATELRRILAEKGYDGIEYDNHHEGAGKSYIAFYPEQVIIIDDGKGNNEADLNGPANFMPESQNGKVVQSNVDQEIADNDMYSKDPSQWNAENKNDTTVSKSLKEKLAELFGKSSNKKPPSISEIVKQIEQDFNVPVSKGKFKQKAYGIYKHHAQAIRTKISNALPTIAHELGHHLDYKYNLRYFESIGELERVLKETRPNFYNSYKPKARPGEAVAEFMRDYLADRTLAKEKYPFFYEEFERKLSESGPQGQRDLQNLKIIGDKINEYYNTELRERAKASIVTRKEAKKINRVEIKLNDILLKTETEMLDDAAIFKRISQKAYNLYYWAKKSSVRAKNALTGYYMPGFKDDVVKQRDKNGNVVKDENGDDVYVPALKFILSEIESGQMFEDFNEYLVLRHGIEWIDNDLRVFADDALNNKKYMSETISELEKTYPQFKEISENLYDWYRTFVYEYGVESGLMTKEQYKSLVEKYPCYVPFMRNVQKQSGGVRASVGNQNAPIKRAKGSGLEILNPIENIVVKVEQFMKAADRNAVMQEITNTIDSEEGFGWLLEQVPPDMVPTTISGQLIKNKAKKTLEDSGMDEDIADEFSHLIDILIGDSITDFNVGTFQGENVVAVRRNGKRTLYQVHDKNMLAALTGLNPDQFGVITKAFGKLTRLFKALTTGSNAVWSLVSNAPRDFDSAYKYGSENNPIKYTVDYIKAVSSQIFKKDSETMKLYRTLGGGYNNPFSNARELQLTAKNLIANDKGFVNRVKALFNIVENIAQLADFVETAPRLAEFKRVYQRTGDAKKAMLAAEEVTVNFNRSGKFSKTLDQYLPYFNASLQANAKYAKTIAKSFGKDGDRSFLVKSILTAILKTGIMFGILGLFGEEGEEEYEKLSAYKKNNFYNIYLGNGKFYSIPKSQATGVFDSLLERTFEISRKENVDWAQEVKDFAGYMWLTFGPPLVDDMIVGSTVYDLAKNEDFTGAPIVSSYYEDLEPEMQYNEKTTYIAKAIGQLFGWSPMKIDHIIESNLGVFGLLNKSLGRPEKDLTLGVETKIFTDNAYSTDILNNFYDKADDYSSKAKSYPDNSKYVYKNKQYESVKSIVSALNGYGKEDPELARDFKILARDYVEKFEKESNIDSKLLKLLEKTGEKDILYYRNFEPTYTINKTTYKMESEDFMNLVSEYYYEIQKEYEEIFEMGLSDESTIRLLIQMKKNVYNRISKPYKTKKQ